MTVRTRPDARAAVLAAMTLCAAAIVLLTAPRQQRLDSAWVLVGHLVPFVLATETIAALQPQWFQRWRWRELIAVGSFLVVFCYFVPRMFDRMLAGDFDRFYYLMLTLVPMLILVFVLLHRLGGGRPATVRRMAYANILIMLSGIEDVMFWVWRGEAVPQQWDWAHHINVFLGHVASRTEAYVFIGVHLALAVLVLALPDSLWRRMRPAGRRADPPPGDDRAATAVLASDRGEG